MTAGWLQALEADVHQRSALRFSDARRPNLVAALSALQREWNLPSPEACHVRLQEEPAAFAEFLEDLTVKETYFFRLPEQFEGIRNRVLPELEATLSDDLRRQLAAGPAAGRPYVPLRAWCVACATGEEPYSLAMTIASGLAYPRAWGVEIWATDLSRTALRSAATGIYEATSASRLPSPYRERFTTLQGDRLVVDPDLRTRMTFAQLNLVDVAASPDGVVPCRDLEGTARAVPTADRFHLILCRNVLIYLDPGTQQRVVDALARSLRPGGYLFTGDAEPLHLYTHGLEPVWMGGAIGYRQRPDAPSAERSLP
jgi:chemotaxis protein methyltransferase CheR